MEYGLDDFCSFRLGTCTPLIDGTIGEERSILNDEPHLRTPTTRRLDDTNCEGDSSFAARKCSDYSPYGFYNATRRGTLATG